MREFLDVLKAMSDESRLRIIMILKTKTLCVCEIVKILELSNSTVSAHLKSLRQAGIIDYKKNGKWIEYFIADSEEILKLIDIAYLKVKDSDIINSDREKVMRTDCLLRKEPVI